MNRLKTPGLLLVAGLVTAGSVGAVHAECKRVRGHIVSEQVSTFSNGKPCMSELGLCTEGRFSGRLKGRFRFTASTLTPFQMLDGEAPPDVVATTGIIRLRTQFCGGKLVFDDTAAFSASDDGYVASLSTVNRHESTGRCAGATGRVRVSGVFQEGCVDCEYEGEVCRRGGGEDDDKDRDH